MNILPMLQPEALTGTQDTKPDIIDTIAKRSKILSALVVNSQEELYAMPREALIRAAWQGLAEYHRSLFARGGEKSPENIAFRKEVDFRLSLLTPEERELAVQLANAWLNDNFSE